MAGGHGSGLHRGERTADFGYLTQLATAAERNGFESVLIPTGQWCAEAWQVASSLIAVTDTLKFLVAFRPGAVSPTLLAQQAATFQDLSGGRLAINVVVGGEDHEQRQYGDFLDKQQRYERADEALEIAKTLWNEEAPLTFHGEYLDVENVSLARRPATAPPVYIGGSSDPGIAVAARRSDVYLTWGEPPEAAGEKIRKVQAQAAVEGRELEYGVRLHVIARATEREAWAKAQELLDGIDPEDVQRIQSGLARSQSEGQRRMTDLHGQGHEFEEGIDAHDLEIYPGLWTGVGLVRGGAGTALVGSYEQVAALIDEYREAGFTHFILSGYPHLEEAFEVGEGVVPALQQQGITVKNHEANNLDASQAQAEQLVPFVS